MTANIERSWRVAALAALLLGGCTPAASTGDAGRGGDGGGSAGLVGTWGAMQCSFCASSDCVSCDQSYTFGADGSLVLALSATYSTSASSFPGCTITMRDTGYLYTGYSNNLHRRTRQHYNRGARAKVIWRQCFYDLKEALAREKQLKGWTRAKKLALASGNIDQLKLLSKRRSVQLRTSEATKACPEVPAPPAPKGQQSYETLP